MVWSELITQRSSRDGRVVVRAQERHRQQQLHPQ